MFSHRWRMPAPGLYFRVLATLMGSIVVVLIASTAINVSMSQERLRAELLERAQNELRVLNHTSSVYFAQMDTHQLNLIARAATEGGQPLFVASYGLDGALLAAAAAPSAPDAARRGFDALPAQAQASRGEQLRWSDDALELAQPVVYYGQLAGALGVRFDTASLRADLQRELVQGVITTVLLAAVLSLLVGLLLRRLIIVPLRRLSDATDEISAGHWIVPAGQQRSDEFGKLARSFGQMVQALQAREAQLQEQIGAVQALNSALDSRVEERTRELREVAGRQEELLTQIRAMSTPVVPVLKGVIVVPLIGSLDRERSDQLIQSVLAGIEHYRAHVAMLDITGATMVDDQAAATLVEIATATRLLGARTALVGVRPETAQSLVQIGADLSGLETFASLREALAEVATAPTRRTRPA